MTICLAVALQSNLARPRQATGRNSAEEIAQVLRHAREVALSRELPTAVVFSTDNGTKPLSTKFEVVEGESSTRPLRQIDLNQDHPGFGVFLGQFRGANPDTSQNPMLTSQMALTESWQPSKQNEAYLLFSPTGEVYAKGVASYQGSFRILITQGCAYSGASGDSSLSSFQIDEASSPSTVSVSPLGEVSVTPGIPFPNQVQITRQPLSCPASQERAASTPSAVGPSISSIRYSPDPKLYQLPSGIDQLVAKDGFLSARVEASSPEAAYLTLQLKSDTGVATPSLAQKMQWDSQKKVWVGWAHWKPPSSAADHSTFNISLEVLDDRGNKAVQSSELGLLNLEIRAHSRKVIYSAISKHDLASFSGGSNANLTANLNGASSGSNLSGSDRVAIFSAEADSTDVRQLTFPRKGEQHLLPDWSPDGRKVLYLSKTGNQYDLWVTGSDGTGAHRLVSDVQYGSCGWSQEGSLIGFQKLDSAGQTAMWVARSDGAVSTCITPVGDGWTYGELPTGLTSQETPKLQWSKNPDGSQSIVTTRYRPTIPAEATTWGKAALPFLGIDQERLGQIVAIKIPQSFSSPSPSVIELDHCDAASPETTFATYRPTLHPEGNWVAYTRVYRDGTAKLCKVSADTSASTRQPEELADAKFGVSETVNMLTAPPGIGMSNPPLMGSNQSPNWGGLRVEPSFTAISSTGKQIYFHGNPNGGDVGICSWHEGSLPALRALLTEVSSKLRSTTVSGTVNFGDVQHKTSLSRLELADDEVLCFNDIGLQLLDLTGVSALKNLVQDQNSQRSGGWSP